MKENALFYSNESWNLDKLPAYISQADPITDDPDCLSEFNSTGTVKLNGYITTAILETAKAEKSDICIIQIGKSCYASEWKKDDGSYVIAYANDKGVLNAAIIPPSGKRYKSVPELGNPSDSWDTSSILALFLQICCDQDGCEARECLNACIDSYRKIMRLPRNEVYKLNDYVQETLNSGIIPVQIINGSINQLTAARVKSKALTGELICGHSDILMPGTASMAACDARTVAEARRLFQSYAASRVWSIEEENRIRSFPDDYIVPEEIIEMAQWYIDSRGTKLPANNMCWRGITGCGKSTGAALLSCILHMPLYIMTCSTNMETSDFLSTLIPAERPNYSGNLPTVEDIWLDPEHAYEQITGIHVDGVTSQQTLEKYGEACAASSGKATYYKRVSSEYVKALESGAIVEIQEFSRIRDSGVLVGLNEYDHAGAIIPLVDGSYTRRHEDAICIWTDNVGYGSCRSVDPSVMRRMTMITDTFELDKDKVIDRAMYNTDNCLSKETVTGMYEVWKAIRSYCEKEDITEGDLSPSDLENWIARVGRVGISTIHDTCRKCLISKVTTDRETQERIISTVATVAIDKWLVSIA